MQLEGSVCVLTGATGGIGMALATRLAAAGSRLILSARDEPRLATLTAGLGTKAVAGWHAGDLTAADHQEALAALAIRHDARVLINLSGANRFGLLADQSPADAASMLSTNLIAPIQLTQRLLPHFASRVEAAVVNVGSAFGSIGYPGYALYSASKFGLRGFSEALRRELAGGPVRVLYVAPRATRTSMNSAAASAMNAALGNAEDPPDLVARHIVQTILWNRPDSTIGWPERFFCRLNQTAPKLVDRAVARQLDIIRRHASADNTELPAP